MRLLAVCAIALAFGFFGSMPLAGPISVMVVSRAAQKKYSEALSVALGGATAEAIYAGIAYFAFTELAGHHHVGAMIAHGITAVVLVALGVHYALWKPKEEHDTNEGKAGTWLLGFGVSAVNPTLLVTWGAVVAFLYSKGIAEDVSALAAIPFGLSAGIGIGAWFALLVALVRKLEGKLPEKVLTWTVRGLGVVLVGLGAWSGVQFVLGWVHEG